MITKFLILSCIKYTHPARSTILGTARNHQIFYLPFYSLIYNLFVPSKMISTSPNRNQKLWVSPQEGAILRLQLNNASNGCFYDFSSRKNGRNTATKTAAFCGFLQNWPMRHLFGNFFKSRLNGFKVGCFGRSLLSVLIYRVVQCDSCPALLYR